MFEKTKKFVKEHKTEIIAGSVFIVGGVLIGYKINKMNNEMKLLKNTNNTFSKLTLSITLSIVLFVFFRSFISLFILLIL